MRHDEYYNSKKFTVQTLGDGGKNREREGLEEERESKRIIGKIGVSRKGERESKDVEKEAKKERERGGREGGRERERERGEREEGRER